MRDLAMKESRLKHIYGPVPSRRLGRSLGIDLVPFKTCTYDCVYCNLGKTTSKTIERKQYTAASEVLEELEQKLACPEALDYISLAGSGEPTLNSGIGNLILEIKRRTDIPVAVLTNGSLLWMSAVQDALMEADLVLPSLDAGDELLFDYVNRPHRDIAFERMVDGLAAFTDRYRGEVWVEILLLAGVTGIPDEVEKIASILKHIRLTKVQMNTVVRPPAEEYAKPLSQKQMLALKGLFQGRVDIISDIDAADWERRLPPESMQGDLLSLLSRRPCTSEDVAHGLGLHANEALKYLNAFVVAGNVATVRMGDKVFYTVKRPENNLRP